MDSRHLIKLIINQSGKSFSKTKLNLGPNSFSRITFSPIVSGQISARLFSSESPEVPEEEIYVKYQHGFPKMDLKLPSRQEICTFTLKPVTSNVSDLISDIKNEDPGIDRACVYSTDGKRIASSTNIGNLLAEDFVLSINDKKINVSVPPTVNADEDEQNAEVMQNFDGVRTRISQLYSKLNSGEHQLKQEQNLIKKLELLKEEVLPLQAIRDRCEQRAVQRTKLLMVGGMAAMAFQYGFLARLTWWEYSWDIMEPVTYFVTAGQAIIMYGYFLLTQQEYIYPAARDRAYIRFFYKQAKKENLDVEKYNELVRSIEKTSSDLQRLRDPLDLNLPLKPENLDLIPPQNSTKKF